MSLMAQAEHVAAEAVRRAVLVGHRQRFAEVVIRVGDVAGGGIDGLAGGGVICLTPEVRSRLGFSPRIKQINENSQESGLDPQSAAPATPRAPPDPQSAARPKLCVVLF